MITILDGKLTVPENQRFIGFAGDNMQRKIEFVVKNHTDPKNIYRLYLTFEDGTVNYFTLPANVTSEGTILTWYVKKEHIFSSGIVYAQIKAFCDSGVIFHTNKEVFIVGSSTELEDFLSSNNTEFLEYEKRLNSLHDYIEEARLLMPYIGENGNWYLFDSSKGSYVDSEKPSVGKSLTADIADGAVTSQKIASGAVTAPKLGQYSVSNTAIVPNAVTEDKLSNNAVSSSKIVDGAVTASKIADNSIDYNHLNTGAVTPDALDREYLRLDSSLSIVSDSSLLTLLKSNVSESKEHFKKIFLFVTRQTQEGQLTSIIGAGRCFGFFVSGSEFWFTNLKTNKVYSAVFTENELVSVSDISEQEDFVYAGYFTSASEMIGYNFEDRKTYFLRCSHDKEKGLVAGSYFVKVGVDVSYFDGDVLYLAPVIPNGKTYMMSLSTGECILRYTADRTYDSTSENAQSGKAVAEAISSALGDIDALLSEI